MTKISYIDIDYVLLGWTSRHSLHVFTDHKGEETRAMIIVDKWGDQYQLYAVPDFDNGNQTVAVGADLMKRAGKKHTFHRERIRFHFRKSVSLPDLAKVLDEALLITMSWGEQSHNKPLA